MQMPEALHLYGRRDNIMFVKFLLFYYDGCKAGRQRRGLLNPDVRDLDTVHKALDLC